MKPARDSFRYRARIRTLALLGAGLLRGLGLTWRVESRGEPPFGRGAFVGALWHQGLLPAAIIWRGRGIAVPVSQSRDGDQIEAVLRSLGFAESPRGSSSRGASALLRAMIKRVRAGEVLAMLPDGPRGPAGEAKPGVIALASSASVPLVPVGIAASAGFRFGSWDRALLPYPFARVRCVYGPPIDVPKRVRGEEFEALRRTLEQELHRLNREAETGLQDSATD